MTEPDPSATPESEPLMDLQRLIIEVRNQRRMWIAAGLLGLLAGALLTILLPATPTATAQLLIIHEGDQPSDNESFMRTDVALMQTTPIAAAALQRLGVNESPDDFLESYHATALTNNLLEVAVRGSSNDDAVARARALADAFIADHVQRTRAAADAQAQALTDQRDQTKAQLAEVEVTIAATPRTVTGEAATRRDALLARRAELSVQSDELGRRAEEAAIGAPQVAAGTQIVDGPRALRHSLPVSGARNAGIGLLVGLITGLALAAIAGVVRDRPLLRRDIAGHLGAPVIAQLSQPSRGPAGLWRRSRAMTERKRVAATLARTVPPGPAALSLLELGCPRTAAALAIDIAAKLAVDGPVVVVNGLPGRYLGKLTDQFGNQASPIRVEDIEDAGHQREPARPGTRRIGVGSVAPGTAWTDLGRFGSETVLVVRAGHASAGWLHTVARQLANCQIAVIGVVLVHPDPLDRSDGMLWGGPRRSLPSGALRDREVTPPDDPHNRATLDGRRMLGGVPGTRDRDSTGGG